MLLQLSMFSKHTPPLDFGVFFVFVVCTIDKTCADLGQLLMIEIPFGATVFNLHLDLRADILSYDSVPLLCSSASPAL